MHWHSLLVHNIICTALYNHCHSQVTSSTIGWIVTCKAFLHHWHLQTWTNVFSMSLPLLSFSLKKKNSLPHYPLHKWHDMLLVVLTVLSFCMSVIIIIWYQIHNLYSIYSSYFASTFTALYIWLYIMQTFMSCNEASCHTQLYWHIWLRCKLRQTSHLLLASCHPLTLSIHRKLLPKTKSHILFKNTSCICLTSLEINFSGGRWSASVSSTYSEETNDNIYCNIKKKWYTISND